MKHELGKQVSQIIKGQADKVRLTIVNALKKKSELSTEELLKITNVAPSTLSFHLSKMKACKLITSQRKNGYLVYSLNNHALEFVYKFMSDIIITSFSKFIQWKPVHEMSENEILKTYALHSDPIRIRLTQLIAQNPGISGKELIIDTNESEANISFHLKKLIQGKWIICKKISNQRFYWLDIANCLTFHIAIGRKEKHLK